MIFEKPNANGALVFAGWAILGVAISHYTGLQLGSELYVTALTIGPPVAVLLGFMVEVLRTRKHLVAASAALAAALIAAYVIPRGLGYWAFAAASAILLLTR